MLKQILTRFKPAIQPSRLVRHISDSIIDPVQTKEENLLKQELDITGVHMDEIDEIMIDGALKPIQLYYPKLNIGKGQIGKPLEGHNLVVIQPWAAHANFGEITDPELQLEECVSLGNTIYNWNVIGKKLIFTRHMNRKQLVGYNAFEDLKELIYSHQGVSAVLFGVELLSGIQLSTLEKDLQLAVYDRFTVVLNIFRQHARTKEAKIQLALAELPYIRSHLREIHQSSEYSSSAESLRTLVGGAGERFYHQRLSILKARERRLKHLLTDIRKQRDMNKKLRRKSDVPVVAIVGYTNCGKTSLIKYLTGDKKLVPKDQLFATLDVTSHNGQLPSSKNVFYLDTVGFLSRIPTLLVEAFSATLMDVQESNLIVHILDVSHPDHRLQHVTVTKALESLKIPRELLQSKITLGNKVDMLDGEKPSKTLPNCDLQVSVTQNVNLKEVVELIDNRLMTNLKHDICTIKVENGGLKYSWLRKNSTIVEVVPDEMDGNYLICRVIMSPVASGRWHKRFGSTDILSERVYADTSKETAPAATT